MGFLTPEQLNRIGFKYLGKDVLLSDKASIYNAAAISIGDQTRIDDFCILSAGAGGITLGRYIHIACFCSLIGQGQILMEDFCGLSSKVSIYSSSDDFTGAFMTNPTLPDEFRNVKSGNVMLRKHALVGSGAVIMPNVELGEGAVLGALTFATKNCAPFSINVGSPARRIKSRKQDLLARERDFKQKYGLNF